jgi:hypothetical protein
VFKEGATKEFAERGRRGEVTIEVPAFHIYTATCMDEGLLWMKGR